MAPYPSYMAAHMAPKLTNLPHHPTPPMCLYKPPIPRLNSCSPPLQRSAASPLSWPNSLLPLGGSWRPKAGRKEGFKGDWSFIPFGLHGSSKDHLVGKKEEARRRRREALFLAWRIWRFAGRKEAFKSKGTPDLGVQSKERRRVLLGLWLEEDLLF